LEFHKYKITVNNKTYEVEIRNINARPVIAFVDEQVEVMPEKVRLRLGRKRVRPKQGGEKYGQILPQPLVLSQSGKWELFNCAIEDGDRSFCEGWRKVEAGK
jgi:hypothetical protein